MDSPAHEPRPGRTCPIGYRYGARALSGPAALEVDTLWVAGGLYGNPYALESLLELYGREPGSKALVFNGDFHWFDVDASLFDEVQISVEKHAALRGNVETELAAPGDDAGCGCGYPEWVGDETVALSNRIIERLKRTARRHPAALGRLAALPMHLVARVGAQRVAVVHGDGESLAGWGFSQEALAGSPGQAAAARQFDEARVRIFASSHTCLPVLQCFARERAIVNNGAAGMPNFRGTQFGLATRISVAPGRNAFYGTRVNGLHVEAVRLDYDVQAWERSFLAQWPPGSDAYRSYYERIAKGPGYTLEQALRSGQALAA
jgi:hypothetical protein